MVVVGFVNVLWDGLVHAYLEDVMVAAEARNRGVGVEGPATPPRMAPELRDASSSMSFDEELRTSS